MLKLTALRLIRGLLFSGLWMVGSAWSAETLTLCYENEENRPWQIKDGKGLSMGLLELTASKLGVNLAFIPLPWKRCLTEIETGQVDGGFSASYNEDRARVMVYPMVNGKLDSARRMRTDSYSIFRLKGSPVGWDGNVFSNLKGPIGVQWGYSVAADLRKKGVEVDDVAITGQINMRKLLAGRVQALALLTFEGETLLSQPEFAGKVEVVSPPFIEKGYFLVFSRDYYAKNKKGVEEFWTVMARTRDSYGFKALRLQAADGH